MKKTFAISHCANAVVFKEEHEAEPTAIVALYDGGERDWGTAFKKAYDAAYEKTLVEAKKENPCSNGHFFLSIEIKFFGIEDERDKP